MTFRMTRLASLLLSAAVVGCVTPSTGLDLSVRGILTLVISRPTTASIADTSVSVADNGAFGTLISLDGDQFFTVNGARLNSVFFINGIYFGQVGAVDAPGIYTVAFNNKGTVTSMDVTPPTEFTATTPAAGANVSKNGFTVTWTPNGDASTRVDLEIQGLGPDGDDDDTDPDTVTESINRLPDTGTAAVAASDLSGFNAGAITLTIRRYREFNQTLGLASGTVRTSIVKVVPLVLQ